MALEKKEFNNGQVNKQIFGKQKEIAELLKEDIIKYLIKRFNMEEKEALNFETLILQGQENDKFYILGKGAIFRLIKDGKETDIILPEQTIIGETTLMQYLNGQKTKATASVEVKGKYYVVSFERFKQIFKTLSINERKQLMSYFKDLENRRSGKKKIILK